MTITITPQYLRGTITPPPSKSQAHRVIIAAALGAGESQIRRIAPSQDITATLGCMAALGAQVRWQDDHTLYIVGTSGGAAGPEMDCGESGSTLRFLMPVALALSGGGTFRGHGRLMQRPQTPYFEIFQEKGIAYSQDGDLLTLSGTLTPGTYNLPGDVSSQFITGLLYALPLLPGDSEIRLTTALQSAGYVDMTLDALEQFGVKIIPTETGYLVPGNQQYQAKDAAVEPDYSQAAFFCAARSLGSSLEIAGMNPNSCQGDKIILDYSKQLEGPGTVTLDVGGCPDLVPALAAQAALRNGEVTRIVNAGRLRIKESDRLASVTQVLNALGAEIHEEPEGLTIFGKNTLSGGVTVDSWNDHRIAMMTAVAATRCQRPVTLTGAQAVNKSYPTFWQDYAALGGILEENP
jgi:3-phosphoshikimate 1-carboxyvinyltransferase